jgi:hypothetical protein
VESLLQQAEAKFTEAEKALQKGDLQGYADAQSEARELVERALEAAGAADRRGGGGSGSGSPAEDPSASPTGPPADQPTDPPADEASAAASGEGSTSAEAAGG